MIIAGIALCSLILIWVVYPAVIFILSRLVRKDEKEQLPSSPLSVGVVIAAHNEAALISDRIQNIAITASECDNVSVIVVSDGSDDNTPDIAKAAGENFGIHVIVHDLYAQSGRANAHNIAVEHTDCDVIVFTDAETSFDPNCLYELIEAFSNPCVGFASGVLCWSNTQQGSITRHAGMYWIFELAMRRWETNLGINVFGSGACCAVRKRLYRTIPPTGDVDFTTPIDVKMQGYLCVQVESARATDKLPESERAEFRSRVRMTAKNLRGTVSRWGWRGVLRHPVISTVLLLHKVGRWSTPFLAMLLITGSILMMPTTWGWTLVAIETAAVLLSIAGALSLPIPLASAAWSFLIANTAFALGVLKAILGIVPSSYRPIRQYDSTC